MKTKTGPVKTFLGIASFQTMAVFRRGLFYAYLTVYLRHFLGMSVTSSTLFATLPMIVNVLAQRYVWGELSDRLQKRRALVIRGEVLGGIGTILLYYAHRIPDDPAAAGWTIILGMCLIELFWSMSNIGWSALISDIYKEGDRSSVMGRLESMGGVGRIGGILAGGILYDRMGTADEGWGFYEGSLFWISGAIMFLSVLPMYLVPEGGIHLGDDTAKAGDESPPISPLFYTFIAAMTLIHFGRNAVAVTFPQYLTLDSGLNMSAMTLGHVTNLRSIGLILAGLVAGAICRRMGDRTALALSSAAAALSLFMIGTSTGMVWICLSSFLNGASEVVILAASYELASAYIPPESRGRHFAVFNATFFLSWGVGGTLIAGPLTDSLIAAGKTESFAYMASFNACGLLALAGTALMLGLYVLERRPARRV